MTDSDVFLYFSRLFLPDRVVPTIKNVAFVREILAPRLIFPLKLNKPDILFNNSVITSIAVGEGAVCVSGGGGASSIKHNGTTCNNYQHSCYAKLSNITGKQSCR